MVKLNPLYNKIIIIPTLNDDGDVSYEEELSPTNTNKVENMTLILDKENPLATKVQTRDGRKARILGFSRKQSDYRDYIYAHIDGISSYDFVYFINGKLYEDKECDSDLINVPEPKEEELLPCPFCGGAVTESSVDHHYANISGCNCDCEFWFHKGREPGIRQWNIRTAQPIQPQWIKCSYRMPNHGDFVLCFDSENKSMAIVVFDEREGIFLYEEYKSGILDKNITHWMPLPSEPENE